MRVVRSVGIMIASISAVTGRFLRLFTILNRANHHVQLTDVATAIFADQQMYTHLQTLPGSKIAICNL
ncbi:MAG: hypothetical protein CMQ05_12400 [Gammaproteobacteria bacterium]|nr:hypothetical protein [Gammaproteobacteria bacterium]